MLVSDFFDTTQSCHLVTLHAGAGKGIASSEADGVGWNAIW